MAADFSQRFIFEHSAISGELVRLEHSYQAITKLRPYPSSVLQFLGKTLASNVLLSSTLKYEGQSTMQMQHDGPLKMLVAKCDNQLHIRGLAQWDEQCSDEMLRDSFKHGQLIITIQPKKRVDFYQSIVSIDNQPIAQVMEHYFTQSVQLPTRIWLAVSEERTVGLMLQKLPHGEISEENSVWPEVEMLTDTITEDELLQLDNQTILHRLYHEHDVRLFEPKPIEFQCDCSLTKMEGAILTLGKKEALDILEKHKKIAVTCDYCNHEYAFSPDEINTIFTQH